MAIPCPEFVTVANGGKMSHSCNFAIFLSGASNLEFGVYVFGMWESRQDFRRFADLPKLSTLFRYPEI